MVMGVNCRAWGNEASLVGALRVTRKKIGPRRPFPQLIDFNGAPERIRTSDPQIRSLRYITLWFTMDYAALR